MSCLLLHSLHDEVIHWKRLKQNKTIYQWSIGLLEILQCGVHIGFLPDLPSPDGDQELIAELTAGGWDCHHTWLVVEPPTIGW